MKNIFNILIVLIITLTSCKAQQIVDINTFNDGNNEGKYFKDLNNNFTPYLGTWEWQNGNQIFRATFWKVEQEENKNGNKPSFYKDIINGHYELIEVNGTSETTIYTSQRNVGQSNTPWFPVIRVVDYGNGGCGGTIFDNSIPYNPKYLFIRGSLLLDIIDSTNQGQMEWKVSLPDGMYGTDQPTTFNIPTDIILTKQ